MVYNTLFVGKVLIHLDKIDSTNKYATQLLKTQSPPEGTIVSADCQYAGKGQRGNTWESQVGQNITLSLLLYPNFLAAFQQFLLSQSIALAIHDFATNVLGEGVRIKWPNDVYYKDKKTTGILIENSLSGRNIATSIVGIGINVNQVCFSPSLQSATSFHQITGRFYDLPSLIQQLAHFIEVRYLQLKAMRFEEIRRDYLSKLYRFNEWHTFEDMLLNEIFEGKIVGVEKDGKLVIEDGGRQTVDGGRWTTDGGRPTDEDKSLGKRKYGLKEVRFCI